MGLEAPGQGQLFVRNCFQPKEAPSFRPEAIHSARIDETRLLIEKRVEEKRIAEDKLLKDRGNAEEEYKRREAWDEAAEEDRLCTLGLLAMGEEQLTPEEQETTPTRVVDRQRMVSRIAIPQTLF